MNMGKGLKGMAESLSNASLASVLRSYVPGLNQGRLSQAYSYKALSALVETAAERLEK